MIVTLYLYTFLLKVFIRFLSRRFTTHPAQHSMDSMSKHNPDTEDLVAMGNENHPGTFVSHSMDGNNQRQAPGTEHEENDVDADEQRAQFSSAQTVHLNSVHVENKDDR